MKNNSLLKISVLLTSAAILVACGGGDTGTGATTGSSGSGSGSGTATPPVQAKYTIAGVLKDAAGMPIPNANIAFDFSVGNVQTTTAADGSYLLKVPALSNYYPDYIAGVVKKDGYVNGTLVATTQDGSFKVLGSPPLNLRTEADLEVLNDASRIVHLGDGNFAGSANSQLQVSTQGLSKRYDFNIPSARATAQYSRTCIGFDGRGIQSASNQDSIKLGPFASFQTQILQDTPDDGSFGFSKYCFDFVPTPGANFFTITSGNDNGARGSNYDDFEIINPTVTLEGKIPASAVPIPAVAIDYSDFRAPAGLNSAYSNAPLRFILGTANSTISPMFFPVGTKNVSWNFGDGSAVVTVPVTTAQFEQPVVRFTGRTHTFLTSGNKTVTVSYLNDVGAVISKVLVDIKLVDL